MTVEHLELKELPYVDSAPDVDQKRIPWIRNGEALTGAETRYGSEGLLNAAPYGIQKNVERLEENAFSTQEKINVLVDNVNIINDALIIDTNIEVVQQVGKNKENIEILQVHMQFAENDIGELQYDSEYLKTEIGVYNPEEDSVYRTIRNDLQFVKTEMGQYPDQDINGLQVIGNESKGMKRRIIDNSSEIVRHSIRIQTLEDNYSDSDVGSLNLKIDEIREELGSHSSSIGKSPIYVRLTSLETDNTDTLSAVSSIKTLIDFTNPISISTRVTSLETNYGTLERSINAPITGTNARLTSVETSIGTNAQPLTINGRLSSLRTDHTALSNIVGADTSSGLRGQVAWINQTLGPAVSPPADTVQGRLNSVIILSNETASIVQDIQVEIGTNTLGLKGQVLTLGRQMNGTNPNGTTVEERGVLPVVKQLDANAANLIPEAPNDGKAYVRRNKAWVDITTL
ncbi:fibritin neck whisker [Pectobacterium bacteriophage PM2]|uniref:Fibritin neck whiskers n=1 Tax=Pectobacterium bacteriophage PM2 TaxID=1429794 RepID=A0A0A0PZJ8_9CAUD|nr:fibritin neck whisker [Pectobacterium bacteriophage PM2]AHY25144.1 fibritin neck whiskers [Pectobacterium bacteriophage PM2]